MKSGKRKYRDQTDLGQFALIIECTIFLLIVMLGCMSYQHLLVDFYIYERPKEDIIWLGQKAQISNFVYYESLTPDMHFLIGASIPTYFSRKDKCPFMVTIHGYSKFPKSDYEFFPAKARVLYENKPLEFIDHNFGFWKVSKGSYEFELDICYSAPIKIEHDSTEAMRLQQPDMTIILDSLISFKKSVLKIDTIDGYFNKPKDSVVL